MYYMTFTIDSLSDESRKADFVPQAFITQKFLGSELNVDGCLAT